MFQINPSIMIKRGAVLILLAFPLWVTGQRNAKTDSLKYYTFIAEAYYDMVGDYAASAHYLTKAIRLDPMDFELYQLRALSRGNTGMIRGEAADYTKVIQLDPSNIAAFVGRAAALMKLKKYEEAIRDYDFLIQVDPHYYGFYLERGKAKLKLNDKTGACSDFRMAAGLGSLPAYLQVYELCLE